MTHMECVDYLFLVILAIVRLEVFAVVGYLFIFYAVTYGFSPDVLTSFKI